MAITTPTRAAGKPARETACSTDGAKVSASSKSKKNGAVWVAQALGNRFCVMHRRQDRGKEQYGRKWHEWPGHWP